MPDGFASTGNKEVARKEQASFHRYLLRVVFLVLIMVLLDALLLVAGENQGALIAVDAIGVCIASVASMIFGETIDKKLVLLCLRIYKWTVNHGWIEVSYADN